MCGIAGIIKNDKISSQELTKFKNNVSKSLFHRGPENLGFWNSDKIALLHRRLKIIDLDDSANQPMFSECGRYSIIFNGEIYNFKELQSKFLKNYTLRTKSDTEVLLNMFIKYGEKCLKMLNGIFAFAILDIQLSELHIVRDNYGVKPLYYYNDKNSLIFASEIKGLFSAGVKAELNRKCIGEQIIYGYVSGENTIYKNVKRLIPGHFLKIKFKMDYKLKCVKYFDLTKNCSDIKVTKEIMSEKVIKAIKNQTISDVPVGFMCSGGLDSSLIASVAARFSKDSKLINTYCAKIPSKNFDESLFSQKVADYIGSSHHIVNSNPEDVSKLLPSLIWAHDEPLKHPNSIPIYQVNKVAKEKVTVLLTGEGADEVFAGYWVFPYIKKLNILRKIIPNFIKKILLVAVAKLGRQGKTFQALLSNSIPEMFVNISSSYNKEILKEICPGISLNLDERTRIAKESHSNSKNNILQSFLFFYQQIHLVSLFDRQDKMSMINSIEGRVPFVDVNVVNYANSAKDNQKINGSFNKYILREISREFLPNEIFNRDKYAFALPIFGWMKKSHEFNTMLQGVESGFLVRNKILSKSKYRDILNKFRSGDTSFGDLVWNILNLDLACQIFIENKDLVNHSEFKQRTNFE